MATEETRNLQEQERVHDSKCKIFLGDGILTFIDMFCGIGTIRMGMEMAGHECVYSIEWDKHKRQIYSIIFGGEPDGADITKIHADQLPRADCWCFGAPCQDFSIAGKRAGLEGDRSSLVREVFRLVRETKEEYRPKYLFYENVKGMLSSNKGFDFLEILIEMESLGYDTIEYSLLNSKDFGVPQNRERVFTIGHSRNRSTRKIFPIGENDEIFNITGRANKGWAQTKDCATTLRASASMKADSTFIKVIGNLNIEGRHESACRVYNPDGIAPCLNTCGGGGLETKIIVKGQSSSIGSQAGKVYDSKDLFPTLCAGTHGYAMGNIKVRAVLTPDRLEKRQNGCRFKEPGEPMFTLTKQDIHGIEYQDRIRKLTPKECWRLQGIPDEITDKVIAAGISDTQMYRGAGDATTVNVIYEIAKRL